MIRHLLLLFLSLSFLFANAQSWTTVDENNTRSSGERKIIPEKYLLVKIDDQEMKERLLLAPLETANPRNEGTSLKVMLINGSIDEFKVVEYQMMEPLLAAKYPAIRTFYGQSKTNPHRSIRIDHTLSGFRAVIEDQKDAPISILIKRKISRCELSTTKRT